MALDAIGTVLKMQTTVSVILGLTCFVCVTCQRPDTVVFPGERRANDNKIPEEILIRMKDIRNASEFIAMFVQDLPPAEGFGPDDAYPGSPITGKKGLSAATVGVLSNGGCMPEMQVVPLEKPKDASVIQWPMCIRVQRCGGCCTSQLLECVPIQTSTIHTKILKARYVPDGGSFTGLQQEMQAVTKHDKCRCECKQRPEHCTSRQVYEEEKCACVCINAQEAEKCRDPQKIWDPEDCMCKCRNEQQCSTGSFYNTNKCRCEPKRSALIGYPPASPSARRLRMPSRFANRMRSAVPAASETAAARADPVDVGESIASPRYRLPPDHVGIHPDQENPRPFTLPRIHDDAESRKIRISDDATEDLVPSEPKTTRDDARDKSPPETMVDDDAEDPPRWYGRSP